MLSKKLPTEKPTNFATIPLTHGMTGIVDPEDLEWLSKWKWKARKSHATWYAVRDFVLEGIVYSIKMHRAIMACPKGLVVHHKNHKSLDNRRANLEIMSKPYHDHVERCGW